MNLQAIVERAVTALGYDLVEVERSARGLLRVTIDHAHGHGAGEAITVDDCEKATRHLQYVLDVEGLDYQRLEVSSPGLDRPLHGAADYRRFAGQPVQLTLREPFQGRKRFVGTLEPREGAGPDAWRLVLDDSLATATVARKPGAGKPEPRSPSRARPVAKTAAAAVAQAVEVLDFELAEVREAHLVPVLDFKGRRGAPAAQPPTAEKVNGGLTT
jgi:ribosome maturation factor RimP